MFWKNICFNYLRIKFHLRCASESASGSIYARVPNNPRLVICNYYEHALSSVFWLFQDSKYTKVLIMPLLHRILNMLEYVWICLNNAKLYLNISIVWMILFTFRTLHCFSRTYSMLWILLFYLLYRVHWT